MSKIIDLSNPKSHGANESGRPPSQRFLPIEADEAHRNRLLAQRMLPLDHVCTLHDLVLAHRYEGEKQRLFACWTADQQVRDVIDAMLDEAINQVQEPNATVVGIILVLINQVLHVVPALRKQILGPPLHHSRSASEVRAEMACVSKTLARLQEELDATEAGYEAR